MLLLPDGNNNLPFICEPYELGMKQMLYGLNEGNK